MGGTAGDCRRVAALMAAAAVLVGGCDGGSPSGSSQTDGPASATRSVSASPSGGGSSSASPRSSSTPVASPLLADGRYPAYITKTQVGKRLITVDVVQFFTGPAASKAAAEDHAPEVPPPNDYWIRNENKRLRTLPVELGSPITVNTLAAAQTGDAGKALRVSLAKLAAYEDLEKHLMWVRVHDGRVTALTEQFLP